MQDKDTKLNAYAMAMYVALKSLLHDIPFIAKGYNGTPFGSSLSNAIKLIRDIDNAFTPNTCPFCGGFAKVVPDDTSVHGYWVKCSQCGVEQGKPFDTREEAIEAWDRRVRHD